MVLRLILFPQSDCNVKFFPFKKLTVSEFEIFCCLDDESLLKMLRVLISAI